MANSKISALTSATTPLAGTEVLPIVQSSTKKVSVADFTAGRDVSMATLTTTGKGNFGNSPGGVIGRADVAIYFANRASNATTANLFVATTNALGADIGGSIAMGGYASATDIIPLATWSGRKQTSGSGNYAGYALLTISDSGGGTVDAIKVDANGNLIPLVAAKGVNFTANTPASGMTSQLLNWYEEGTWTPSALGCTLSSASGQYTRIGRVVVAAFDITFPVTIDTTNVTISPLPFTVSNAGGGALSYTNYGSALIITAGGTTTNVYFYNFSATQLRNIDVSGKRFIATITYFV